MQAEAIDRAYRQAQVNIAAVASTQLPALATLQQCHNASACKNWLQQVQQQLDAIFLDMAKGSNKPWHDDNIKQLLSARAALVDAVLIQLFSQYFAQQQLALCAVGGYGRAELHPYSDIDIMLLGEAATLAANTALLEQFIASLWDLGLEIGHSVRTSAQTVKLSASDITICTALMESRLLCGAADLFAALKQQLRQQQDWNIQDFYTAKLQEQNQRYKKFAHEGYRVEPNVKYGQGGLRDLQNINWVIKRYLGVEHSMFGGDFLSELEHRELLGARNLLWSIRYGLHLLSRRAEDRLMFDLQRRLALLFGDASANDSNNDGVERFMQRYYRAILRLERLNEMLLQLLYERIFATKHTPLIPINANFCECNSYLEVVDKDLFLHNPRAILEVFVLMQQHQHLKGVGAQTIRAIRQQRHLIDDKFRRDKKNQRLFLALLQSPNGVTREFRRMNRYGVLARYLPEFGNIVGRMQFDLYHIYTVDQHTIAVLGQSRIFVTAQGREQFAHASEVYQCLDKPWLLHLAALFHDIGKGCGGDHSIIGAQIIDKFCRAHGFKKSERKLCVWLVREHLLMSTTSSRKDLSDPEEIAIFVNKVGDQRHLDYLYLLTIADINGTNPSLYTSWRAQLLYELYSHSRHALRRGVGAKLNYKDISSERQRQALSLLRSSNLSASRAKAIWQQLPAEYFARHTSDEIAWHCHAIANCQQLPLITIMSEAKRGASPIMIYTADCRHLFAKVAICLNKLQLSVLDARVITSLDGRTLDTFLVHEADGSLITSAARRDEVCTSLAQILNNPQDSLRECPPPRRLSRQLRELALPTKIQISSSSDNSCTVLEISTSDSAGVLANIGCAFVSCDISLQNARINTLGERVDDVFFITAASGEPLSDQAQINQLLDCLHHNLDPKLK